MKTSTQQSPRLQTNWVIAILIIIIGYIAVFLVKENHLNAQLEKRQIRLASAHQAAVSKFSNTINTFAAIVAGMQSFINSPKELPNSKEFQHFIQNQLNAIHYKDSIVVSYIDTTHTFIYSFTRNSTNSVDLINKSVTSLRTDVEINRLNHLMTHDSIKMFYPINLIEGWLGLPINFRIHRDHKTLGYIAPIIDFKSIIQNIYSDISTNEFVYHFSTDQGIDFDSETIYDGSRIFHNRKDPSYYKNFQSDTTKFVYSAINYYGLNLKIGTAYKSSKQVEDKFTTILYTFYFSFILFILLITFQTTRLKKLNLWINKANDLLEKKRVELAIKNEALTKLNDGKDKMFSIIGHDLKGPLNSIRGLLQLLEFEKIKDPGLRDVIQRLGDSTKNTSNLLENLLRWARSQTGDIEYNPKQLFIHKLVEEVINELRPIASEKKIKILATIDKNVSHMVDADMTQTVFRNLISNAIKFTNKGGEIKLTSELSKNTLFLKVIDNGIGMQQELIDQLFRLDRHLTTEGTSGELGTGLGLLICSEFIKKHGGRIEVKSTLGDGTSFALILPH